jgi:hypothetical protein
MDSIKDEKILIAFSDVEGLVYYRFLPKGHRMNLTIYRMVLQ